MLNLSHNKLNRLKGLSTQVVPALIALNLGAFILKPLNSSLATVEPPLIQWRERNLAEYTLY